jgi:tRNA(fMet)-specific endonuclease VapC
LIRYLLDANVLSAVSRNPDGNAARRFEQLLAHCATSIIVAAEIRYGIAKLPDTRGSLRAGDLLIRLPILPFESPADVHYGGLRAELERQGTPIGANDMLIAAHALALDCILVTANEREFRRVPGLRVENWAT